MKRMPNTAIDDFAQKLLAAQNKARQLLVEIEKRELIKVGLTESQITKQIYDLAADLFGTQKHWHRQIVYTGTNSALSFKHHPEDQVVKENDLVYLDLGPVFDEFEGDIGKTYLLGNDPKKKQLLKDLEQIWLEAKSYYLKRPSMTGAELWHYVIAKTEAAGWSYGSNIAGHIIGEFSHIQRYGNAPEHRINELNNIPMDTIGEDGQKRHWILEIHLIEPEKNYGAFFEDLLTL